MVQCNYDLMMRIHYEMKNFSGDYSIFYTDFDQSIAYQESEKWEAASCIKVYILAVLAKLISTCELELNDECVYLQEDYVNGSGVLRRLNPGLRLRVEDIAILMIAYSDNIATNMVIRMIGIDRINDIIHSMGFKETTLLHSLDFEKYNDFAWTTSRAYGLLMSQIYHETLIDAKSSRWMKKILEKQQYAQMLTGGWAPYYMDAENTKEKPLVSVASKSGALDHVRNDGGIITTKIGSYVVVIFTKDFQDTLYHSNHESFIHGQRISDMIFNHFLCSHSQEQKDDFI